MDLHIYSRQWDYTDPAQRILIAERCRAMLDALASNASNVLAGETGHEPAQMAFAYLVNARVYVDKALRYMREQAMPAPQPGTEARWVRGIYTGEQPAFDSPESIARAEEDVKRTDGPTIPIGPIGQRVIAVRNTATAAHACLACGRHPDTHVHGGEDSCGACGLGDAK